MLQLKNLDLYLVDCSATIYECLLKFEQNNYGTVLVVKNGNVIGSVTDGDVRKALIRHRILDAPVKQIMNLNYHFANSYEECKHIFTSYPYIKIVPLLNNNRQILMLYGRN